MLVVAALAMVVVVVAIAVVGVIAKIVGLNVVIIGTEVVVVVIIDFKLNSLFSANVGFSCNAFLKLFGEFVEDACCCSSSPLISLLFV